MRQQLHLLPGSEVEDETATAKANLDYHDSQKMQGPRLCADAPKLQLQKGILTIPTHENARASGMCRCPGTMPTELLPDKFTRICEKTIGNF